MISPVFAIGLDAMAPCLLEHYIAAGKLPTLARLFREGIYARQKNFSLYRTENSWLTLLHGCTAERSGEWGHQDYTSGSYSTTERASYRFTRHPPFYALCGERQVAIFDVPLTTMQDKVAGVQLLGWGTEVNQILRQSSPPHLMAELIARHGRHPLYDTITNADDGSETLSYRIPCIYDLARMRKIKELLIQAVHQRTAIIQDLLQRGQWDFLMAVYGEIHTAGHLFWHLGQSHPLSEFMERGPNEDFILEVLQAIDADIGKLMPVLSKNSQIFVFSPHGMQANTLDLYSMFFLPELLYRWSSGEAAFIRAPAGGEPLPPPRIDYRRHWREEIWDLRTAHGNQVLESPYFQEARQDPMDWDPGNWYRPLWPRMRAFVLPGYSEGLIRINVAGRDGPEGIDPRDFNQVCEEISRLVNELSDPRTGKHLVKQVIKVRHHPEDNIQNRSAADIMVLWQEGLTTDAAEHPLYGRIGPAPFFRSGGHATEGFVLARGNGFSQGVRLPPVTTPDVTATILDSMGIPLPEHVKGKPLGQIM